MTIGEWTWIERDRYWSFKLRKPEGIAELTIMARPAYCDRGRWVCQVYGIPDIDWQDGFPRYYMDLERAKLEGAEWLAHRLKREEARTG